MADALLLAVGDVAPDRPDPRDCFALSAETLRTADLAFCQLECNLTARGDRLPQARHTHRSTAAAAQAMREAGLSIVSFAGNHCMDWGREGFFDTIANLRAADLSVVGVGANIAEARAPIVREANGVRAAFLAYSSILPMSYWAEDARPGCAPMRAFTIYEQIEHDQPGTPARVHTYAHRGDLDALTQDIARAKTMADAVIVSFHWGIHFVPAVLADYQRETAHAAIDAGADLILGHHAHILKGVEVYRGKTIFYSLGNFAVDLRMTPEHAAGKGFKEIQALSPGWEPDFDSLYNFPPDSRMTLIAQARLTKNGVGAVSFRPAFINRDAQPEVLAPGDPRFGQVFDYMRWCTDNQDLPARLSRAGDAIAIEAAP
jgi:poly-gamma-glutamate synthesis protein (capsule biosynthesis protein)